MSTWVLIVLMFSTGDAVYGVEFSTKEKCETAAARLLEERSAFTRAFCVQK